MSFRRRIGTLPLTAGAYGTWVLIGGGVPASLDIDFVNDRSTSGAISSLLSCTRATPASAYYTKADGTLTTFAANVLRYGTNGLLVEEARTNICLHSQTLDDGGTWFPNGGTVTANAATAPDGTVTAESFVEDGTLTNHRLIQFCTQVANTTTTLSIYVKRSSGTRNLCLVLTPEGVNGITATFDLTNIVVDVFNRGDGANAAATITTLASGWYRCALSGIVSASAANPILEIYQVDNTSNHGLAPSNQGDGTSSLYLWGAQLEAGAFATSYIPTTTASVTRAADVVTFASESWHVDDGSGTYYAEAKVLGTNANPRIWGSVSKTPISKNNTDDNKAIEYNGAASATATSGGALWSTGAKAASASNGSTMSIAMGGGTVATDASGFGVLGGMLIGSNSSGGNPADSWNGYILRLAFWNSRLSNGALQTLTT